MEDANPACGERDLELAKLLKCINTVGKRVMCDVAKRMYSCDKMNTNNGSKPLRRYMYEKNLQVTFEDSDFLLDCNIRNRKFDLPSACKIITDVCKDVYEELSDHCKTKIAFIAQITDQLCFEYSKNPTILEIQARARDLKVALNDIYKGVAKTLNKGVPKSKRIDFTIQIQEMTESLQNIMAAQAHGNLKFVDEFKEKLFFKIVQSATSEILQAYGEHRKYKVLNPCTRTDDSGENRFDLETVFTLPELTQTHSNIEMSTILTTQSLKGGKWMIPETIIIKGEAGSGKTSLCRFIVHTWTKQEERVSGVTKFHLLLLVEISRTTAVSLEEFLKTQLMRHTMEKFQTKDVIEAMEKMNVLIVIDGYDERTKTTDKLLNDIYKTFQKTRIILTSRTCALNSALNIVNKHNVHSLLIDLKGFNAESRKHYITKVFEGIQVPTKGMEENRERFQMYIDGRGQMLREHLKLPLTIALLIVLWLDDPENVNNVTTITSLYQELFNLFQKKLMERLVSQGKFRKAVKVPPLLEELLLKLGEQAWNMLREAVDPELPQEYEGKITKECKQREIDSTEFLCAFLKCEIEADRDDKRNVYLFLHRTQTEYVAALYLADLIHEGKNGALQKIANEIEDWEQYQQLLLYLTGNLALRNTLKGLESEVLDLIARGNVNYSYYSYWWNLVSESIINYEIRELPSYSIHYTGLVHPKIGEIIATEDRFLSRYVVWEPNDSNIAAALRLIALIPVHVATLKIEIPDNIEPFDISDFIEAIEEVGEHKVDSKTRIATELKLNRHVLPRTTNGSDRFLLATQSWAKLTVFSGSLKHEMNLRGMFPKLKNIHCKIANPDILKSFKNLTNTVRILRITISFSQDNCSPSDLQALRFTGTLEFTFHSIKEENSQWMVDVLIKLAGQCGFERLCLEDSELSYENLESVVSQLNGHLHNGLRVNRVGDPDDDKEQRLNKMAYFNIDWKD
ncbi:uncharacterized protein LOC135207238 [Macrobrachium nipponense]|uniref:uncharacterized protein LOC135207238 n=1 Tax=Macrobrachium nipponense TaxID=159736 RepID=UPI0030C82C13